MSICALDHSALKASLKTVVNWRLFHLRGTKSLTALMCCSIWFFVVFLVNVGPADNHGQRLMQHCRTCCSPKAKGRQPDAALWRGTDGHMWLWNCHVLPRAHHANVKMILSWTEALGSLLCLLPAEMWCFCGSSVFGCMFVLFCSKGVQFLIWHLCQGRALTLKKG